MTVDRYREVLHAHWKSCIFSVTKEGYIIEDFPVYKVDQLCFFEQLMCRYFTEKMGCFKDGGYF